MDKSAVLYTIDGDYGLISMHPPCIQSILYTKFQRFPTEVKPLSGIKSSALYTAPSLVLHKQVIDTPANILSYLNEAKGDIDRWLTAKQTSETLALTNLTYKLKPVLDFLYWVDQRNCDDFISRWHMAALPFPFNYTYTKKKRAEALALVETLYPNDSDPEVIRDYVTKAGAQVLSTLSTKLGKNRWFHGSEHATSLDAVVYAYVAPILKLPFPGNDLVGQFALWQNLSDFVKRVDAKYFPNLKKEVKYLARDEKNKSGGGGSDEEVSYVAVFILVASATAMALGFALKRGIISLRRH